MIPARPILHDALAGFAITAAFGLALTTGVWLAGVLVAWTAP